MIGRTAILLVGLGASVVVTASSAQNPPDVSRRPVVLVSVQGAGTGRVTSLPPSIDCTRRCSGRFPSGSTVVLSATPSARSRFAGWSHACIGRAAWCVLEPRANVSLVARFVRATGDESFDEVADTFITRPVLNVTVSDGGGVTSKTGRIDCPSRCWDRYDTGTRVTLHAEPKAGYVLKRWSSLLAACGRSTSCAVKMNTTIDVVAVFIRARA